MGEGMEEAVRDLVGVLVALGDGAGGSPAVDPAVAMVEEADLADVTEGCLEEVAMEACTSRR